MAAYEGKSLSGHPTTGNTPAHMVTPGVAPPWSATPREGASPVAGGAAWVGEEAKCAGLIKKNGWPCEQPPRAGKTTCFGHKNLEA